MRYEELEKEAEKEKNYLERLVKELVGFEPSWVGLLSNCLSISFRGDFPESISLSRIKKLEEYFYATEVTIRPELTSKPVGVIITLFGCDDVRLKPVAQQNR